MRKGALSVPVFSWALYDFANTIFSYVVVTRYFNDWLIDQRGTEDIWVGFMQVVVAIVLVLTLPVFGALADRWGRRKPLLIGFTLLCVVATALLGYVPTVTLALVVGGVAIFGFNTARLPITTHCSPASLPRSCVGGSRASASGWATSASCSSSACSRSATSYRRVRTSAPFSLRRCSS